MMDLALLGERALGESDRRRVGALGQSGRAAPTPAKIITALDLGVSKTVCALAAVTQDRADLIGAGVIASPAAASGKPADYAQAVRAIRLAVDEAERCAGVAVSEAVASYAGPGLHTIVSHGRLRAKAGVISAKDEAKALQAALAAANDQTHRVLHATVLGFRVDDGPRVPDPKGLEGRRLTAEVAAVRAPIAAMAALVQCAKEAGVTVTRVVPAPFAAGLAALDPEDRAGALVIDLGAGAAGVALFGAEGLLHAATLKAGGVRVTRAVAVALDTSFAAAERAKIHHASDCALADPRETVETPRLGADGRLEPARVLRRAIQDAVGDKLDEIFCQVAATLRQTGAAMPEHAVLVGGGAHLAGAAEIAAARLGAPVVVGGVCTVPGLEAAMSSAPFATAAGLLRWVCEQPPHLAPAFALKENPRRSAFAAPAVAVRAWRWLQESF